MKSFRITIEVDLDNEKDLQLLVSQIQDLVEQKVSADGGYAIYEEEINEDGEEE